MAANIIVGTNECSVREVLKILSSSHSWSLLFDYWTNIATNLEVPRSHIKSWRSRELLDKASLKEIIHEMLYYWAASKGSDATLNELLSVLKENRLTFLAELLENRFCNQTTAKPQKLQLPSSHIKLDEDGSEEEKLENAFTEIEQVTSKMHYFKHKILGMGAESVVYEGTFNSKTRVAVKRINKESLEYMEREIDHLTDTHGHQNVIRYIDHTIKNGFHYIALELCHATVKDWIEKTERGVEVQNITDLEILSQCVAGLMFIHGRKVVHRDIRPSNILLLKLSQKEIVIKISDFGLGKRIADHRQDYSASGSGSGSLGWMAPEVAKAKTGDKITADSSDKFSLGCTFYNVLSRGGHLFGDELNPLMRQFNIQSGDYNISPDLPYTSRGMNNLIKLMIDPLPERRPPLCIVKSHPAFWNTRKTLNFLAQIKALQRNSKPIQDAFALLEQLGKDKGVLGKNGWIETAKNEFNHDFSEENYHESVRDLIRAIRNYGGLGIGHKNDRSTPKVFKLEKNTEELLNDWLEMFPKLLPCAWIAFRGLNDEDVEGFCDFYGDKRNPFWNTDACLNLI